jgi:hypothetical protein
MKKILLSVLCFFFFYVSNYSQEYSKEYGKVKTQELTYNKYPKDTNAEAVVIYDMGQSSFYDTERGFVIIFERTTKIKILKNSGVKWGQVEIPYYYDKDFVETIEKIEASAYNYESGMIKKTDLDIKQVYDEKKNEYWRLKKFAIPNVKEGTVIEFKYIIKSPYLFNLRDWEFQKTIPVVYSEYIAKMIPFYEYKYILQGKSKCDVFESYESTGIEAQFGSMKYHDMVYKFGMKDIPAFNDESFITSINDFILKIDFQLSRIHMPNGVKQDIISTWPLLCNDLLKESSFGKYCNNAEKEAKEVLNLAELSTKSKMQKLESVVNYVKANYTWNGSLSKYTYKTVKEFQKEKTGNSANINLYLAGLLRGAGLDAYPVIISTRGNGSVKTDYPFLSFFNSVIVLVNIDGKFILTDGTEPLCPFDKIPPRCLNETGLIVKKDGQEWAKLINPEVSYITKVIKMDLNQDADTANFQIEDVYSLYEAFDVKSQFEDDSKEIIKNFENKGYVVDSLNTLNYSEPLKPYIIKCKGALNLEKAGDKIYLPLFLNEPPAKNPLKQSERNYPVDFIYPFGRNYSTMLSIPDNYKIESLPDPLTIDNKIVKIDFNVLKTDEHNLTVTGSFIFKKSVYDSSEYLSLKFMYNEIIKKFNEKIVISKK